MMTESDKNNHWKSLADQVGAEVREPVDQPPEDLSAEAAPQDPVAARPEAPVPEPPRRPKPRPTRRPRENHWGLLAGELGIEVPAQQSADRQDSQTEPQPAEASDASELAPPLGDAAQSPGESDQGPWLAPRVGELECLPASAELPESTEAAAPGEQTATDADQTCPPTIDQREDELIEEGGSRVAEEGEAEAEESERRPRRRRRRRHRSARRARDGAAEQGEKQLADQPQTGTPFEPAREEERTAEEAPIVEDRKDRAEERQDEPALTQKTKHRNIPTWEEAISVIVTANLDARSRPTGGTGRRGRGRGHR